MALVLIFLCVLTAAELLSSGFAWSSRALNLQILVVGTVTKVLLLPLVELSVPVSLVSGAPFWLGLLLFFLVNDLLEYLFHRAQHAVPVLWQMHTLHHSDQEMNATTTDRHFWGEAVLKSVTIWPLAALVVEPTPALVGIYALFSHWNYVVHSGINLNFGRFSWVLNSPAYHRRHHSALPEHFNSNFAALFPIFDVVLGSYHRPHGWVPTGMDDRPRHVWDALFWPVVRAKLSRASKEVVAA
jgi:sterol desaturase/sphingolipid hydroxylase (fatty acid hydroxylase superfamily)